MAANANLLPNPVVITQQMQILLQSTTNLTTEFSRIGNLPAFNGNQLHHQIAALQQTMQNGFDAITQRIGTLEAKMGTLEAQMVTLGTQFQTSDAKANARDANTIARVHNSYLRQPTDPLQPLVSSNDGTPIEPFPLSPAAIGDMSNAEIQAVLEAIGVPVNVRNNTRQSRIKLLHVRIGINPNPQFH